MSWLAADETAWRPHMIESDFPAVDEPAATTKPPKFRRRKRLFDLAVGILLIVFMAPLMLIIAALVRLDGGPALFGHRRVSPDGGSFRCWKFRSMVPNAEQALADVLLSDPAARQEWSDDFKLKADPRITRIGRFLRVSSLDELPQLFNVLTGQMSSGRPPADRRRGNRALRQGVPELLRLPAGNDRRLAGQRAQPRRLPAAGLLRSAVRQRLVLRPRPLHPLSDRDRRYPAHRRLLTPTA